MAGVTMNALLVLLLGVVLLCCGLGTDAKTLADSATCDEKSWFGAVRSADLFTVEACLKEHPELGNKEDAVGCTAIVNAAANKHLDVVQALLKAAPEHVNVNHQCRSGKAALHHAAQQDNVPMVRALHKKAGSLDLQDKDGNSPLSIAAQYGNIRTLAYMNSLTEEIFDTWSGSELLWAAAHHNTEHVKVALSREGAHVEERDGHGNTALLWAARTGSVAMFNEVIKHGADITAESESGWTAPFYAGYFRNKRLMQELVKHGVDVHKKDKIGWTAMIWTAAGGDVETISILHSAGASIQEQGAHGWTPLMMAAARGKHNAVNYLLRKGADWRALNDRGQMAWQIAKEKGHDDVYKTLYRVFQIAEGKHDEL
ncbi:hypothetical protein PTSG_06763 [Salpingoeca rosetta]|uniref:Uncharacterized protein n=1 Tax=Salpingoeca rosetta (strain ATCC 50818 / BSB-021) TaxID=946362 RepID=F2UEQ8_SALR5|nr:uncharacterized protein PTSG_06763 [Salpingoeca rosetta]EGD75108.1 hypothetical protein PTSG_06763 [Salpingoeca rosetta]|eukprot:XP_004992161.1 hypothetical protein PTSG_06763 [Salpingoeca rosetta]